jgi:hypothetical protein
LIQHGGPTRNFDSRICLPDSIVAYQLVPQTDLYGAFGDLIGKIPETAAVPNPIVGAPA